MKTKICSLGKRNGSHYPIQPESRKQLLELLNFVPEGELSSTIDLGRRKGGLALVIDVDSFGTKNSPLTPGGGTSKDSSAASIVATEGANAQSPLVGK